MLNPTRTTLLRIPFAVVVLISWVVLFTPASGVPSAPPWTDKVIHLLLFGALAATGSVAGFRARPLLVGLVCYAVISEVLQAVLPIGRDGDVLDAAVDLLGGLGGWWAARPARRPPQ